ncbi:unnamed protein product, partial [Closterium sp. Naga37s-1]
SLVTTFSDQAAAGTLSLLIQRNATRYSLRYTLLLTGPATAPKRIALYQRQHQQPVITVPLPPLACAQPAPSVWHCSGAPTSPPLPAAPLAALLAAASTGTAGGATAGGNTASETPASGTSGIGFSAAVVAAGSSSIGALSRAKAFYAVPSALTPVLYPTAAAQLGGAAKGGVTVSVSSTNTLTNYSLASPSYQPLRYLTSSPLGHLLLPSSRSPEFLPASSRIRTTTLTTVLIANPSQPICIPPPCPPLRSNTLAKIKPLNRSQPYSTPPVGQGLPLTPLLLLLSLHPLHLLLLLFLPHVLHLLHLPSLPRLHVGRPPPLGVRHSHGCSGLPSSQGGSGAASTADRGEECMCGWSECGRRGRCDPSGTGGVGASGGARAVRQWCAAAWLWIVVSY